MARRLQLHEKLCEILGSRNVYFQPPESVKLNYDCIVYKVKSRETVKADDLNYLKPTTYEVKIIYRDPDSTIPSRILDSFRYCYHNNTFVVDNLYHDIFTIYY